MIKSTILTVYTDNSHTLYEDIDEVLVHGIITLDSIDYVKFVLKQISNKPEIEIIKHDVHAIMEKICSLCDENDVNFKLIFIIGHNLPYLSCKSFENNIAKMIDKIVDTQNVTKYAPIIKKIKAQLENKHRRVICGIRKNTLIVNLFDLREESLTCHNIIVKTLQQQINLKIELKNRCETKLKRQQNVAKLTNTLISKIIPTNQTGENEIKKMKDKEINMTKDTGSSILLNSLSDLLSKMINDLFTHTHKCFNLKESSSSPDEPTKKTINKREQSYLLQLIEKYLEELYPLFNNLRKIDVANENTMQEFSSLLKPIKTLNVNESALSTLATLATTIKASSSSPDAITKESNISNQAAIDDEEALCHREDSNTSNQTDDKEPSSLNKESSDGGGDNKESSSSKNDTQVINIVPNTKFSMISLHEAFSIMKKAIDFNISERLYDIININDAYGRIVCQSIHSDCNVPAFRVSTKHGFAVLASDGVGIRTVLDKTTVSCTNTPVSLQPGTCVWVKSGERIPEEATAVVPVKDAQQIIKNKDKNKLIMIKIKPEYEQNIKNIGSDIQIDEPIIHSFTRIGSAELGLLTAVGYKEVMVSTRVIVGILSIGDLLEEPGNSLTDGYVYDSNRISIIGLLKDKGFDSLLDCGIVADNTLLIIMKIKEVLEKVDVLVTIGCASNNDRLKRIFTVYFNANIHFGHINIKPGKSTTFGTFKWKNVTKYFLCLSKNPVTTLITAHLYLIPLLNGLHRNWKTPEQIPVKIHTRYVLHERPRVIWTTLKWNEKDNFATAFSKENLEINRPHNNQPSNALIVLPQKEIDFKVMPRSFVNAFALNISS